MASNEAQMRAEFLKSVIALGLDRTYDGKRFVNQRTDDTWRGYKFALSSLPRMTRAELITFLQTEGRESSHRNNFSLNQAVIFADALIALLFPQIVKEKDDVR